MKKFLERYNLVILGAFAIIEIAVYIAFMIIENALGGTVTALKYSGILLAFLTTVSVAPVCGSDGIVMVIAMFFTAVSDLFIFLLFKYEIGVSTFIVVQIAYFVRIYLINGKMPYISAIVRAVLIAVAMISLGVTGNLTLLTGLVAVYFPMLVCNAAESVFLIKRSKRYVIFFVGLLLFIGCDICVGLFNFSNVGISFSRDFLKFVGSAIWAFYLPSQTLIVLSSRCTGGKLFNEK